MELTREQFCREIEAFNVKDTLFNVTSVDSGSVYLSLHICKVGATLKEGTCGEISMNKPYSVMGVVFDFAIVNVITKEKDGFFRLKFKNGMSDVVIRAIG